MTHYCTIFDKNYLFQGLTVYRSLLRFGDDFRLYVLCFDEKTFDIIKAVGAPNLVPVALKDIETEEMLKLKTRTSYGQYCWASQPFACEYLLDHFKLDMVTYLEADSMFFSHPAKLFEELGASSVSLVPHRYTPCYDQTAKSGRYCVQFNAFRNDASAHAVLRYWKDACLQYTRDRVNFVPGQLSLDSWPEKFKSVKEIQNLGAGVAPWNVQQYKVEAKGDGVLIDGVPLVFYHYHEFARYPDGSYDLGSYAISKEVVELIYKPYVKALGETEAWIKSIDRDFNFRKMKARPEGLRGRLRSFRRVLNGTYNVYQGDFFSERGK